MSPATTMTNRQITRKQKAPLPFDSADSLSGSIKTVRSLSSLSSLYQPPRIYDRVAEESSRLGKQKVKPSSLPFDPLVAGTPLIATIFSPSGGVGKSSQALNLAVYIAAIVDFELVGPVKTAN
jgi:Mrp family chromosome partitioning ATPase